MSVYYHTTVVSSIGTSILTNKVETSIPTNPAGVPFNLLKNNANKKKLDDFDEADREVYQSHLQARHALIRDGDAKVVRGLSAELNGIYALNLPFGETHHLLLCTDTVQGKATAEIVRQKLVQAGVRSVEVCVLAGMTTAAQEDFAQGIDCLLNLCEERLVPLRAAGHKILFNLVGGFKSLQAYLQMLGMIYADEICYLFEAPDSPLLRIPRLPLHFDFEPLRQSAVLIARLATGAIVPKAEVAALPAVYVEVDGDDACLSVWGKLVWNTEKAKILAENLLEHPGLRYELSFQKDFEKCQEARQRIAFQEAVAKASVLWAEGGLAALRQDGGLQYETYQNRAGVGHFRAGQGPRISCVPENAILVLRHAGPHDYVNDNP